MEQQPSEFYERVREGYRELATQQRRRIVLINGSRDPDQIETEIWEKLCSRFSVLAKTSNI
jgi:thymidylate kinase